MKILVIRHGLTKYNKLKRLQGQTIENPLTPEGIKAAKQISTSLPKRIDVIYTSDLLRTRQTTEIINKSFNTEVVSTPKLREIHFGSLTGDTWDEIAKKKGKEFVDNYLEQKYNFHAFSGESFQDVKKRVLEVLEEIKQKYYGKKVLLVTHGGIIRFLQYNLQNKTHASIHNISIHEFEI